MHLLRRRKSIDSSLEVPHNADTAWKALSVVTDWVKHAESKSAATLAASGVSGTLLYNLIHDVQNPSIFLRVSIASCGLCLVLAIGFSAWSLRPRIWARETPSSAIYFQHIARRHQRKNGPGDYSKEFSELMVDQEKLIGEIASQIWANAHVARQKYQWGSRALASLLAGIIVLAVIVITISTSRIF